MSSEAVQPAEEALYKPYDQFILFGDSITQFSNDPQLEFGLFPALQDGWSCRSSNHIDCATLTIP